MNDVAKKEKKILKFWQKEKIFAKSIEQRKGKPFFGFYDGPPFATGKPHVGHILPTAIKDTVLRYWTMKGYQVPRRVGWDCHGLPVENLVERELGIKSKKDIEKDIGRFNRSCRSSVFRCVKDFQRTLEKVGRWADYSNAYATLDNDYIESVWWVFKQLWDQDLIYKGYRVTPYCPHCGTPLSNFEVNQGYRDIEEESVYVKFKIKNNKYFLVWTTTPWTLPANVALAVNKDEDYVEVKVANEVLILANQRLKELKEEYKIVKQLKGKDLLGLSYEPLYQFRKLDKKSHYVIEGDFVSMEDGTGIVHIAPAFGEDDMKVGIVNDLPIILNVNLDGTFMEEVTPWANQFVKKANPQITQELKQRNLLYKTAMITHAYPFCWRCDAPLLYYALDSWYVSVVKIREQLVKNNRAIHWVPNHLKYGRFGKWLEGAKDWAISRSRFWGAPIPIWQCSRCDNTEIIDSVAKVAKLSKNNVIYLARHAESKKNVEDFIDTKINSKKGPLTAKGEKQAKQLATSLKDKGIDLIYASPLLRTRQTAAIIAKELGVEVVIDNNLKEIQAGAADGKPCSILEKVFINNKARINKKIQGIESLQSVYNRVKKVVEVINQKHKGKSILVISHGDPLWMLQGVLAGVSVEKSIGLQYPALASLKSMPSKLIDLHRPSIDKIKFKCQCGGIMERIEDVFDCWFESGSMPYGQWHYPFENKEIVEKTFPANFIAEGLDQTRGWFYTLHVLATALTLKDIGLGKGQPAFKNVVVNGLILDDQGKKLSKKLGNYVDPEIVFEKYGADALRYFLLSSTPMGEDYRVSEKNIEEVWRRIISTLWNVYVFFNSYLPKGMALNIERQPQPKNILDQWMLSRLSQLNDELRQYMDDYELVKACRLFDDFIDDFSNWYVRRSRRRFQKPISDADHKQASHVFGFVLFSLTKLMAPFTPFVSEEIYLNLMRLSGLKKPISVHLCDYPKASAKAVNKNLNSQMILVRQVVALGLAARSRQGLKVRQPLAKAEIRTKALSKELMELVKEELNVKEVVTNPKLKEDIVLDVNITPQLKEEGLIRDLVRQIQQMRKDANLKPQHLIYIRYSTTPQGHKMLDKWSQYISEQVSADKIDSGPKKKEVFLVEKESDLNGQKLWLGIKKA